MHQESTEHLKQLYELKIDGIWPDQHRPTASSDCFSESQPQLGLNATQDLKFAAQGETQSYGNQSWWHTLAEWVAVGPCGKLNWVSSFTFACNIAFWSWKKPCSHPKRSFHNPLTPPHQNQSLITVVCLPIQFQSRVNLRQPSEKNKGELGGCPTDGPADHEVANIAAN